MIQKQMCVLGVFGAGFYVERASAFYFITPGDIVTVISDADLYIDPNVDLDDALDQYPGETVSAIQTIIEQLDGQPATSSWPTNDHASCSQRFESPEAMKRHERRMVMWEALA